MQPEIVEPSGADQARSAPTSQRQRRRATLLLTILSLAILGVGGAYYIWEHFEGPGGRRAVAPLVLYGNVEVRQADLAFGVEGPIARMLVDEGDRVETGQTLAVLEQDAFLHAEANAEAMLQSAEALLAELLAGSRQQEVERARANVAAAEAAVENAELNLRRVVELARREHSAQQALDSARLTSRTAAATLRQQRAELALRLEGARTEEVARQRAEVAAQRANLALQRYRLARSTLRAPNAGVILTRIREPGAVISASAPVFTMSVIEPVWIRTYVDEPNLGRVVPGDSAEITTDAKPHAVYRGRIGYVSPTAEFTPRSVETPNIRTTLVYRVRIIVQNPDRALRQGMPATIRIADGDVEAEP
jgi:HlyD family secretion protein